MGDNPPAFPVVCENGLGHVSNGMDLRDWFAGQALVGWLAGDEPEKRSYPQEAAYEAYQYADAMIAELKNGSGE